MVPDTLTIEVITLLSPTDINSPQYVQYHLLGKKYQLLSESEGRWIPYLAQLALFLPADALAHN